MVEVVRTTLNNPFEPGSGAVPRVWIGRELELADVRDRLLPRRSHGLFERGRTYLGDPGTGKSVLVNRIAEERAADGDMVALPLRLARGRDPLAALAGSVRHLVPTGTRVADHVADAVARVTDVGLFGASLHRDASTEDRYGSLVALLAALAVQAGEEDRILLLRVDEVQNLRGDELSQLLTVIGDLLEARTVVRGADGKDHLEYHPVIVLLSGLPGFPGHAADAGATFSRRFATTYLEPFSDDEVRAGLAYAFDEGFEVLTDDGPGRVHFDRDGREELVDRCAGDPFLFQLAGAAAWDADTGPVITEADVEAGWSRVRREVRAYVRSKIDGLTELQLAVLTSAARQDGPSDGTTIARAMGRTSSANIGSTLQGLTDKRLLRLDADGYRVVSRALARELRT